MIKNKLLAAVFCFFCAFGAAHSSDKDSYLHFMNGLALERKGNYDSALQEYKRTLLLDPQSIFVYKQALNLALHIGRVDDAEKWAMFVVNADSATADNWVLYGNVCWAKNDLDGARKAYEKAQEIDKDNAEAPYQLASLWSSKDPDKSISFLKRFLELKPDEEADVRYQLAVLYNLKGDYEAMKENLLKSKEVDSLYLQPRYMLANYYEMKSDTSSALAEYLDLVSLENNNLDLFNHLGELYASPAVSNLPEAEKYFLKAYGLDKTNASACFWLSVISEQRRDFAAASGYLETSRDLKDNPSSVLRLSYYYTQSGRYATAVKMLEDAHKRWPDNKEVTYFFALGCDDTHNTPKALELLKGLIAGDTDYPEARMQYAVINEREGNMAEAEESFRFLIKKDPANANILNYLGYSLADRSLKLAEAEVLVSSAVKIEPNNGAYLDSLAWVYFRQGRNPEALAQINSALKLVYDDATLWEHAGEIYASTGDYKNAWRAFKTSFALDRSEKRKATADEIKDMQKKIDPKEAAALETELMKGLLLQGREFSAFAKLYAKFKGKQVKLDAVVHFSPPDDFSLIVMGPLMAPLWKIKLSGSEIEMDEFSLKGLDEDAFKYWAPLMAEEMRGYFSGAWLDEAAPDEPGWDLERLKNAQREVRLDKTLTYPESSEPANESKLTVKLGDYFLGNLFLIPQTFEFKMPFFSLKLALDKSQLNLKDYNRLQLPQ
ncbi:MAG: tetratricopeptide repeat protein [Elusimicrobia bacterium]|nr:tetratricopeptide repeat protein [Elusimicrobiota bacterium]